MYFKGGCSLPKAELTGPDELLGYIHVRNRQAILGFQQDRQSPPDLDSTMLRRIMQDR